MAEHRPTNSELHLAQLAEDAVGGGQRLLALLKRAAEVLVSQG